MSKRNYILNLLVFFFSFSSTCFSTSLDGTSSIVYKNVHNVFHSGEGATGFVRLADGFTVLDNATATFNVHDPVSNWIDLRTTGILSLDGDLYLDSSIGFSSGGYIDGNGYAIYLGGDLKLPDRVDLRFTDTTMIDGQGYSLTLGYTSQLLIDTGITLTLSNLILKNTHNTIGRPAIRCLDSTSKLTLNNVIFDFTDDFILSNGQMYVYSDVLISGTSKFIYQTPLPSFITPHSTLMFGPNTTFFYNPATISKDLIKLQDESSSIYFNNCSFKTTVTGIQLTKGQVYFDNKVTLSSAALPPNYRVVTVSPDGLSVAVSEDDAQSWNNGISGTRALIAIVFNPKNPNLGFSIGYNGTVAYSYDGGKNWIAGNVGTPDYYDAAYSPNGDYLLICGDGERIGRSKSNGRIFDIKNLPGGSTLRGISYSNSGKYIISVGYSGRVWRSVDDWENWAVSNTNVEPTHNLQKLAFKPDDSNIIIASNNDTIYTSTNDGIHWKKYSGISGNDSINFNDIAYSRDGSYAFIVGNAGSIYKSTDDGVTWALSNTYTGNGGSIGHDLNYIAISPDGRYILITENDIPEAAPAYIFKSTDEGRTWERLQIDSTNRPYRDIAFNLDTDYFDSAPFGATYNQAASNSIIFQDLQNSVEPDAQVEILQGGKAILDGPMNIINGGISGGFVFNSTEGFSLDDDIYLDSSATFTKGGSIDGNGYVIYLTNDITVPDYADLRFTDSTIIDGQGNSLILGRRAQLLVDTLTTLTLRNLTLKNTYNTISGPAVRCLDWYGKLALDNVILDLNED
ncbi:MAG: hypothetical protein GF317_09140, partial [Candidatus Lokiarchaeota archaeon]|nr:hypothetical protein [Candidatus Lokiarchaeota archaeon]